MFPACGHAAVTSTLFTQSFRVNRKDGTDEWMYLASDGTWKLVPPDIILWDKVNDPMNDGQARLWVTRPSCQIAPIADVDNPYVANRSFHCHERSPPGVICRRGGAACFILALTRRSARQVKLLNDCEATPNDCEATPTVIEYGVVHIFLQ